MKPNQSIRVRILILQPPRSLLKLKKKLKLTLIFWLTKNKEKHTSSKCYESILSAEKNHWGWKPSWHKTVISKRWYRRRTIADKIGWRNYNSWSYSNASPENVRWKIQLHLGIPKDEILLVFDRNSLGTSTKYQILIADIFH